jgi:Holliday junction resolvase-like predicted endonuclease
MKSGFFIGKTMEYNKFRKIFNTTIFEKSKPDLLEKVAKYPERYVGLFRPSRPKAKIIQNLLQSHEIRFGDAFETLIEEYLREAGFTILDKKFYDANQDRLEVDQIFSNNHGLHFVEQKIRDDHDSTKKRGQIDNFEKKLEVIIETYGNRTIFGYFYFIDDSFNKNKNFYVAEINNLSRDYGLTLKLVYGKELFDAIGMKHTWDEILSHLKHWKKEIPELPEINFDTDPNQSFSEIKDIPSSTYRKLLTNPDLDDLLLVLFPEQETLQLLHEYFHKSYQSDRSKIFRTLQFQTADTIGRLKNHPSGKNG